MRPQIIRPKAVTGRTVSGLGDERPFIFSSHRFLLGITDMLMTFRMLGEAVNGPPGGLFMRLLLLFPHCYGPVKNGHESG